MARRKGDHPALGASLLATCLLRLAADHPQTASIVRAANRDPRKGCERPTRRPCPPTNSSPPGSPRFNGLLHLLSPSLSAHPILRPRTCPLYTGLCVAGNGGRMLLLAHPSVPSKYPQAVVPVEFKAMLSP
jgi:hypothetical protein